MRPQIESIPPSFCLAERGRGEHVLYVDDEEALVFLATRVLERLGYRVSGFSSATRALEAFALRPQDFDAVVTDLALGTMSGLELVSEIRKRRPDIPVVLTSGYVRPEEAREAESVGISEVVIKPQATRELGRVLERLIRRARYERETA
ncbi:MAG TPA: response regulator [Labilithrix sp.]|nr:response regulator [Labilithrix sp.]